jgi:hypothetical protein
MIQKIQEVVERFMLNGSSFSAHDVTVELRVQNERIYHGQVRDMIHTEVVKLMATFGYEKTFTKAGDGSTYQLYKPSNLGINALNTVKISTSMSAGKTSISDFDGRELNFEEDSSWIIEARWNSQTDELFISTKSGKSYIYQGVDSGTILDWEVADSVGTFFNENIKANFTWSLV